MTVHDLEVVPADVAAQRRVCTRRPDGFDTGAHEPEPCQAIGPRFPYVDGVASLLEEASFVFHDPVLSRSRARQVSRVQDQDPHLNRFMVRRRPPLLHGAGRRWALHP